MKNKYLRSFLGIVIIAIGIIGYVAICSIMHLVLGGKFIAFVILGFFTSLIWNNLVLHKE